MADNNTFSYISIPIQTILGLLCFYNLLISAYAIISPDSMKLTKIGKISYGAVKIVGEVKKVKYGQVDFSTVDLNDGTGTVKVLYGLYNRIEDPKKVARRKKLTNVSHMSKEQAIRALNQPLHYDSIEAVGIYYPFLSLVHAYYINGRIGPVELLMLGLNFVIAAFFFYSTIVSIAHIRHQNAKRRR